MLEEASNISRDDPYSKMARTKLIEGSRWILQGTSSVLLCFDESEVCNNLCIKALRTSICILVCISIYMSAIAGKMDGPNGLNFFEGTLEYPGVTKANFFLKYRNF